MPESQERGADEKELVALCTRSLSTDAELRVSAQRYLRERIEASHPDPEEIRNATERLRGGRTKILRPLFVLVVVALSSLPIITLVNDGLTLRSLAKSIAMIDSDLPDPPVERTAVECLSKGLSKEERFFLGSIPESDSPSARHQALWRSDPSNPALFIDYARFYREDGETAVARLPEDFLETGRRLDPDNGFFPAIQGGALANDAVDRLTRLSEARIDDMLNQAKEDLILDEGQYRDALALLYEAASKPRFRSYNTQLLSRRIGLFEHDVDLTKRVAQLAYIADLPAIELKLQDLCNLAMVEAISMARNREVEGFVRLNDAWERVLLLFLKNEGELLVNTMLCRSSITRSSRVFAKCADRLSLDEIAQTWRSREEAIEGPKKTRWASPHDPTWDLLDDSGGELIRMGVRILPLQVSSPPPITESDVRPARCAEHEFFARIGKLGLWIHFAMLGLPTFFY